MAGRIPVGEDGELPISAGLAWALGLFLLLFNHALFLGAAALAASRGEAGLASTLGAVGLVAGGLAAALAAALLLLRGGPFGPGDGLAGALLAGGWLFAWLGPTENAVWASLAGNLLFGAWMGRGLVRRRLSKKRQRPLS